MNPVRHSEARSRYPDRVVGAVSWEPPWPTHVDPLFYRVVFDLSGSDLPVTNVVWERLEESGYVTHNFAGEFSGVSAGGSAAANTGTVAGEFRVSYTFNGSVIQVFPNASVTRIAPVHCADFQLTINASGSIVNVTAISARVTNSSNGSYSSTPFSLTSVTAGNTGSAETLGLASTSPGWSSLQVDYTVNGCVLSQVVNRPASGHAATVFVVCESAPPTALSLSNSSVAHRAVSPTVGTLSATDADSASFQYSLVSGTGSTSNHLFTVNGSTLRALFTPNYLTSTSHSIRLRVTDETGLYFEQAFSISVTVSPPTALSLSSSEMPDGAASPMVGGLSATDANSSSFVYTLVSGTGSTDNGSFTISGGNTLMATFTTDYETKNAYAIRVRVTDETGLYFEQAFDLTVAPGDGVATFDGAIGDSVGQWNTWVGNGYNDYSFRFTQDVDSNIATVQLSRTGTGWIWSSVSSAYYPAAVFVGGTRVNSAYTSSIGVNAFGQDVSVRGCSVSTGSSISGMEWTITVTYANGAVRNYLASS